jgi:hypothetical protein
MKVEQRRNTVKLMENHLSLINAIQKVDVYRCSEKLKMVFAIKHHLFIKSYLTLH